MTPLEKVFFVVLCVVLCAAFCCFCRAYLCDCWWARLLSHMCRAKCGSLEYRKVGRVVGRAADKPTLKLVSPTGPGFVRVLRTTKGTSERLSEVQPLKLEPGAPKREEPTVSVDPSKRFQTLLGFGGSFTESSADLLQKMSQEKQEEILSAYFNSVSGLGYSFGRVHMNSCDFSTGNWACAETPGDEALESFSLNHYTAAILPMIRRAAKIAAEPLKLIFSPWSPPAWMKDTGKMSSGKLNQKYSSSWAQHYVRFAKEFEAQGVAFWGLTVQNEPEAGTPWETCNYSAEEERDFIRDHLGPALKNSGLDLKLLCWDHNRDSMFARASTIYRDPEAAQYVWGTGFHWYGDVRYEWWPEQNGGQVCFENLQRVHELRPDKHIVMTEACQEAGPRIGDWKLGERYAESIIKDFNNWCEGWIDWNLILDVYGGPNWTYNRCSAPIIADVKVDRVLFLSSYYYIGHFSRYIRPGALRIVSASSREALEVTAFVNLNDTLAAVVLNQTKKTMSFCLQCGGLVARTEAPAHSITTFIFESPEKILAV